MIETITNIDKSIIIFLRDHLLNDFIIYIMVFFSFIGSKGLIWLLLSGYISYKKKNMIIFLTMIFGLLLSVLIVEVFLKNIVSRLRPYEIINGIELTISKLNSYSFPSGHASSSFTAAVILSKFEKRYTLLFFILASLVAISRLFLFVHFPSDIIFGALVGIICGKSSIYLIQKIKH